MKGFYCATGLLTRIPLPFFSAILKQGITAKVQADSVKWFAVIGLFIGFVLYSLAHYAHSFFSFIPYGELILAMGLLVVWVALTGIIHWDGLADCADGWIGGRDKSHTLDIMQDHTVGVAAVMVLFITLALKYFALVLLLESKFTFLLLGLPVISRGFMALSLLLSPLAKKQGMAFAIREKSNRLTIVLTFIFFIVSLLPVLYFSPLALYALGAGFLLTLLINVMAWRRIGGITGDVCGAIVETSEAIIPFVVSFVFYAGWVF